MRYIKQMVAVLVITLLTVPAFGAHSAKAETCMGSCPAAHTIMHLG